MDSEFILPLITAFGLGSIITTFVQAFLTKSLQKNDRSFSERKVAYIGLLEAYHKAAVEGTDEAAKGFGLWQMRCELVAPRSVRKAITEIVNTNDDVRARYKAHETLKQEMRKDLGIVLD